jgi:hypothetical protein
MNRPNTVNDLPSPDNRFRVRNFQNMALSVVRSYEITNFEGVALQAVLLAGMSLFPSFYFVHHNGI